MGLDSIPIDKKRSICRFGNPAALKCAKVYRCLAAYAGREARENHFRRSARTDPNQQDRFKCSTTRTDMAAARPARR
jgi:hypothetical protein